MTGPPALRPSQADPGGLQVRADGQQVGVRNYDGELIRIVPPAVARDLVEAGLADNLKYCVRLKLGIRWLPPRLDRPSGRPDLIQMQRRQPDRYNARWKGTLDAHIGKGALGQKCIDATIRIRPTSERAGGGDR